MVPSHINNSDNDISNSINLFISILVRYPSLGAVNFLSETRELKFSFMVKGSYGKEIIENFDQNFINSFNAYLNLVGIKSVPITINKIYYENFVIIAIKRDLQTITGEEISFINEFVKYYFANFLIVEEKQMLIEEEIQFQEELIENMLDLLRQTKLKKTLFAFRERGKVLVFNK